MEKNHKLDTDLSDLHGSENNFDQLTVQIHAAGSHESLVALLRHRLLDIYGVDMASIFLVDSLKMQLVSWVVLPGESLRKIRIPIDKTSIAGYAASNREIVLVEDPYDIKELKKIDPELIFDSSWDRQNNIRTRQVLAVPIMLRNSLLGVIQMMNKRDDHAFSAGDKRLIQGLAKSLANALLKLKKG